MRIAFIGKGGSGKTTLSVLFSQYASHKVKSVLVIDADLNMHVAPLLGLEGSLTKEQELSSPWAMHFIKKHLAGSNRQIKDLAHFKKTTPPGRGSNLVHLDDPVDPLLSKLSVGTFGLRLVVVGSYNESGIGTSCYHNDLSYLENILSHLKDGGGIVVADMVAGVDAFANTLHAQFDLLALAVEPTRRGVEVYNQYARLAESAGISQSLFVIGNKVRSEQDMEFLEQFIPAKRLLGCFRESEYLRLKDQAGGALNVVAVEQENMKLFEVILDKLRTSVIDPAERYQKLLALHRAYVAQPYIRERFGDLASQIDSTYIP